MLPLNIAFVSDYCYPYTKGGVETRYYTLGRFLLRRGHRVTWFTSRQWGDSNEQEIEGIRLSAISPLYRAYTSTGRRSIVQALAFGLSAFRLLQARQRFDVLDVSQYPFFHCFPAMVYAAWRRTPMVVSWYEFWGDHWREYLGGNAGFIGRWLERFVARTVGHVIPSSTQARDRLLGAGCDPQRVHYVPLAIEWERISRVPTSNDHCDVIYFGRLKNHKNIEQLIRAIALCMQRGLLLTVHIIGDGPERENLLGLTARLGLTGQVRFRGRVESYDELISSIKAAALFVHPSTKEGGGSTTLLEANVCGTPVVAVRHPLGFDSNLIQEGVNGYWCEQLRPEAIAQVIGQHFAKSESDRDRMRNSAQKWSKQFDVDTIYPAIEEIYIALSRSGASGTTGG